MNCEAPDLTLSQIEYTCAVDFFFLTDHVRFIETPEVN